MVRNTAVKHRIFLILSIFCLLSVELTLADRRFIVRTDSLQTIQGVCAISGCNVTKGLDGPLGRLFLVTTSDLVDPNTFLNTLRGQVGVVNAELDVLAKVLQATATQVPSSLLDSVPVNYFGQTVRRGYVNQIANLIIRTGETQSTFNVTGAGIVAVIDTGVDYDHPVLTPVLVDGYDFTRDQQGRTSEKADLNQSTAALVDETPSDQPAEVNQSTAALVDQSTAALVDGPQYAGFGHGTMVAGVIHLVAPRAMIMPMKAFRADGSGYLSDILRAIYFSVQSNAKIINMSFSFATFSQEVQEAINFANQNNVICVASVGNNGQNIIVYPAAYAGVIGVASTANDDTRSQFSNYGPDVWVAAPGEGIVTTYPFGTYAAAWGTSFSTPFVSGAVALLVGVRNNIGPSQAAQALGNAKFISTDLGNGRLDLYQTMLALRQTLGLQ
ncbi:MAG TPA: S8 family serine peptidase [Acidobacteriota bacterium]|jgi:subtilisin family serine protease